MLFFARKVLRKKPGDWTFLIVTDRTELDDQIAGTFAACGELDENTRVRAGAEPRAPERALAGQRALHLHSDPEIRHGARRSLSGAVDPQRHHRHHRRGAPQPIRHSRRQHARRAAERRLHRLHRHAADRRRGRAHAGGVRRLCVDLRLRPIRRRRRDGAALLREPAARAAADQQRTRRRDRPRHRRGEPGRGRRGRDRAAVCQAIPPHHQRRPAGEGRRRPCAPFLGTRLSRQGDVHRDRQGDRDPHVR